MLRTTVLRTLVVVSAVLAGLLLLHSAVSATPTYGVVTVGNDADTGGLACDVPANCTLRSAIEYANTHGGNYAIIFTTGVHTFTLGSPLIISGNAISITANVGPVFVNANNNGNAFQISGSDVVLNNLYIYGSSADYSNIWIRNSAQRVVISNNYIGVYPSPNGGVQCDLSPNSYSGIYINSAGLIAPGDARAWIYGNRIMCNAGNPGNGIDILTDHVIVGANAIGAAGSNLIEFNHQNGVQINGASATYNVIRNSALTNNQNGIVITNSAQSNYVLTNTIAYNANIGVWLGGGTYFNAVQANYINNQSNTGVQVDGGAHDNDIGSYVMSTGNGNRIYNNAREGVYISGAGTHYNAVRDNLIGVDGPNGHNGVALTDGAYGNIIGDYLVPGGTATGRNIISHNGQNGVDIANGAHDNTLGGNYIGTTVAGTATLSNTWSGVAIYAGAYNNTLDQNIIGGNGVYGVVIDGSTTSTNTLTLNVLGYYGYGSPNGWDGLAMTNGTFGNVVGSDIYHLNYFFANGGSGIYLNGGSHHNSIQAALITANQKYGVLLDNSATANNVISGTVIYQNVLDGIAERDNAFFNTWTRISTYDNGGLGINTQAVSESSHTPHPPTLYITSMNRSTGQISGKANITSGLFATKVELYRPAPDPSGYGEGRTFVGSTYTNGTGDWSITDPGFTGCYVGFATETTVTGTGSTEFSRNTCMTFLPALMK